MAEYRVVMKLRNKRTKNYNLRASEAELKFLEQIKEEIVKAGTNFESNTDFIIHCVQAVATITKSQTKLAL